MYTLFVSSDMCHFLLRHWFLFGLGFVICFAFLLPDLGKSMGILKTRYTIKYGAVIFIFLLSGLGLKTSVLKSGMMHWKAHVFIQTLSLVLLPCVGFCLGKLLSLLGFDSKLSTGLIICFCMPTTISSNVIMTKQAKGNESVSLINATLGNFLGIIISPILILLFINLKPESPLHMFLNIFFTVLVPIILGQLIQFKFPEFTEKLSKKVSFSILSSCMLLLLVYVSFCDLFSSESEHVSVISILLLILIIMILVPLIMLLCYLASKRFDDAERISIMYCGSTKTLSLGLPLIGNMFNSSIGYYVLPLLIYHASQLFWGFLAAKKLLDV